MLTATSFLFSTEKEIQEVKAEECTYLSYKELCLVCPKCGEPVILASLYSEKQRPHFKHRQYKGEGNEGALACPNRSRPLTDKELHKFKAQAKNQRIDLLRRHFWYVVTNILHQIDWVSFLKDIRQIPDLTVLTDIATQKWREGVNNGQVRELINSFTEFMEKDKANSEKTKGFMQSLNLDIHRRTVEGVCDFLAIKSCYPLLERLILYGFWDYINYSVKDPYNFPLEEDPVTSWALADIIGILLVIPWQEAMYAAQNSLPIPKGITRRPRLGSANETIKRI
jgi:hypothetical protein